MLDGLAYSLQYIFRYVGWYWWLTAVITASSAVVLALQLPTRHDARFTHMRMTALWLLIAYLTIVLAETVLARSAKVLSTNINLDVLGTIVQRLSGGLGSGYELLFNVAMLAPVGLLLPVVARCGMAITAICSTVISLVIELSQLSLSRGVFELSDIVANLLGAMIGYGVCALMYRIAGMLPSVRLRHVLTGENQAASTRTVSNPHALIAMAVLFTFSTIVFTWAGFSDRHPYIVAATWSIACVALVHEVALMLAQNWYESLVFAASYVAKVAIALVRLRRHSIYGLLGGKDAYRFWITAVSYYYGHPNVDFIRRYSVVLCAEFRVFGVNYLCAMLVNILLTMGVVVMVMLILEKLRIDGKARLISILLAAFLPYNTLAASEILREPLYLFFIGLSLYAFVRYVCGEGYHLLFGSLFAMLPVLVLHGGYFPIPLTYLLASTLLECRRKRSESRRHLWTTLAILVIGCTILVIFDPKEIMRNLSDTEALLESFSTIGRTEETMGAGSAYLTELKADSWPKVFLYLPVRVLYFWASPMPTNWRGLPDIAAFLLDSSVHLACACAAYYCIMCKRVMDNNNSTLLFITVTLAMALLCCGVIFAYGTYTAGTAIRHRDVMVSLEVIIVAIVYSNSSMIVKEE